MAILPNLYSSLMYTLIKTLQQQFSVTRDKIILKFIWKVISPRIIKKVLPQNIKVEGTNLPDIKAYYIAIIIKTVRSRQTEKHITSMEQNREPRRLLKTIYQTD